MKKIILCIIFCMMSFSHYALARDWGGPGCPDLRTLADEATQALPPVAGLEIAISNPKCGDFIYTTGEANLDKHNPVTKETKLPIASNTKPVLTALALMLIEENPQQFPHGLQTKLTEIKDINQRQLFSNDGKVYLPDGTSVDLVDAEFYKQRTGKSFNCAKDTVYQCPQLGAIDLNHLMLESSGLADIFLELDLDHDNIPDVMSDAMAKIFSSLSDPGSQDTQTDLEILKKFGLVKKANPDPVIPVQSHNTDAALLSIILQRTSGKTLNALLIEKILKPLHLEEDSIQFITSASSNNDPVSRRYVYLNTDEEIDHAIASGTTLPKINTILARMLKPSHLNALGRRIFNIQYKKDGKDLNRPAIDILALHGQGFVGIPGPGGIVARPLDYIRFYKALANGELLSPASQALFDASFISRPGTEEYKLSIGFGSNSMLQYEKPANHPSFLTHGGLVFGGESRVLYHYETGTTMMIASDFSGYYKDIPCLFVTPMPYLGYDQIFGLLQQYARVLKII